MQYEKKGETAQTSHEHLDLMVTMRGGKKKSFDNSSRFLCSRRIWLLIKWKCQGCHCSLTLNYLPNTVLSQRLPSSPPPGKDKKKKRKHRFSNSETHQLKRERGRRRSCCATPRKWVYYQHEQPNRKLNIKHCVESHTCSGGRLCWNCLLLKVCHDVYPVLWVGQ